MGAIRVTGQYYKVVDQKQLKYSHLLVSFLILTCEILV